MNVQIRGFRKPQKGMKLIVDNTITPIEKSRMKYYQLYEKQMIAKSEQKTKTDYLTELKNLIKQL